MSRIVLDEGADYDLLDAHHGQVELTAAGFDRMSAEHRVGNDVAIEVDETEIFILRGAK